MMWTKQKKTTFTVHAQSGDMPVKDGILFEITDKGEIIAYDGAREPYTALVQIRGAVDTLIRMMQETMERKIEEANRVLSDDLK